MAAPADPVLFQAVCTPPQSLTQRGLRAFVLVLGAFAVLTGLLFTVIGAWPILPFLGGEVLFALALLAFHVRTAARCSEVLLLTPGRFAVTRTDRRGRRHELTLDPYWARLNYREDPGHAGVLRVESRGRGVEIGRDLSGEEKRSLRDALQAALAAARRPDFDNPQLRDD